MEANLLTCDISLLRVMFAFGPRSYALSQDAWDYVHNPYGLLRSPWNLDSTPYVTRFNTTNGMVGVGSESV